MPADRHSYVSLYPSDWLSGMGFMPPLTEWVYLQICLYNWDKCAALPVNEAAMRLSRHAGWADDLEALVGAGKVHRTHSGGLFVERAMQEAQKSFDLWERKSRGGKASRNQDDGDGRVKSVGKTVSKSVVNSHASNQSQSQSQSQIIPNGITPPTPPVGDLVFSVPADEWRDFKMHRIKLKAPMTDKAEKLLLRNLERLWADGHDPVDVLNQSIERGWKGVFEIKGRNGNGQSGNGFLNACIDG
jgi:hypothetical protein